MVLALILACSGDPAADTSSTDVVDTDDTTPVDTDDTTPVDTDDTTPTDTVDTASTGTPPTADTGTTDKGVSYARDIQPLFEELCTTCHYPGSAGDYDLTDPWDPVTGFVGRANSWEPEGSDETVLIDPFFPDNSFLLVKIDGSIVDDHIDGAPMPLLPALLTTDEIDDVETWIADGANNDTFYQQNVEPIFGTEITFGRDSGRCTWCHYPGVANGLNVFDVFDPVNGMVNRPSSFGGTVVIPGDPVNSVLLGKLRGTALGDQMPQQLRSVTPAEVDLVREWITLGALEN